MKKILNLLFITTIILVSCNNQKPEEMAWKRARSIQKGMNFSWLDNYWNGNADSNYVDYLNVSRIDSVKNDFKLMKELGFDLVRLPVTFDKWYSKERPYNLLKPEYYPVLDAIIKDCSDEGLKLIIDYHHGVLGKDTTQTENEINRIKEIWEHIAERYKRTDPDKVFFEVYNEPPYEISNEKFEKAADEIISAIRKHSLKHTIIVGGTEYNSMKAMMSMTPLADKNVIYTFHFYDPFLFTHQGAAWSGAPVATKGVHYPDSVGPMPQIDTATVGTWGENMYNNYHKDGNYKALKESLQKAKDWSVKNNLPIFCGEWGSHKYFADPDSRCRHAKDMLSILHELQIPEAYWEWDQNFSFFTGTPSKENISPCVVDAFGLQVKE